MTLLIILAIIYLLCGLTTAFFMLSFREVALWWIVVVLFWPLMIWLACKNPMEGK